MLSDREPGIRPVGVWQFQQRYCGKLELRSEASIFIVPT
jgi:hypothetical protein